MQQIYLDHAATTPCNPQVVEAVLPWFIESYGNPSAAYQIGQRSAAAVQKARRQISEVLNCAPEEIFFTSGGTESDNWAVKGVVESLATPGKRHILTTKIEHPAVLQSCAYLERLGYEVTYLDVDARGVVTAAQVEAAMREDTILVSIMYANNEIGTIEPIAEIAQVVHERGVLLHTDAVQAFGQVPIDVQAEGIDLLSASGHKIYGPKGVGILYIRKGIPMESFLHGGAQERGRRAGTENVPGIVGMGEAAALASRTMAERAEKEAALRARLLAALEEKVGGVYVNGVAIDRLPFGEQLRLPGNLNVRIEGVRAESALISLDMQGICVSAGSACSTGSLSPSHVLTAIGLSEEEARQSLRFSIGQENTPEEMDAVSTALAEVAIRFRK